MRKVLSNIAVIIVAYTIGFWAVLIYIFLRCMGRVRISCVGKMPRLRKEMIIISNHPDLLDCMYEIFLVPSLFFRQWLLNPVRFVPWFTPDGRNFTDKWYWAWLRPRAISINRAARARATSEVRKMLRVLTGFKGVIVHFAEGGRTCTYKGKPRQSIRGKEIRPLKPFVGWLWQKTEACLLLVWVENGDVPQKPGKQLFSWPNFKRGSIVVRVGRPIAFSERLRLKTAAELTEIISRNLLMLADQG